MEQIPMTGYSNVSTKPLNNHEAGDSNYPVPRRQSSLKHKYERKKSMESKNWSEVWYEFTQSTTLHGVCRITEPSPFTIRKVFWALVVLCGIGLFIFQLVNSVMLYFQRPVTVNIRINYKQSIAFPAITICNLNSFRATKAEEHGYYEGLYNAYIRGETLSLNNTNPQRLDLALDVAYDSLSHSARDFIVNCHWHSKNCNADDFQKVMTNHGVCYTFNGERKSGDKHEILNVTRTGAGSGLKLRLNVEQYEYMPGPNSGAGVKILVHDQKDVPLVKEMGQVVPPGSNGLVGIQLTKVTNLEPPYGVCSDDNNMVYFQTYTTATCQMDCEERYLVNKCHCRMHYMPELRPGEPPVCTFFLFLSCAIPTINHLGLHRDEICTCAVPCMRDIYESVISYGLISRFDTEQILYEHRVGGLKDSYTWAREVNQRVDKKIAAFDQNITRSMHYEHWYISDDVQRISQLINDTLLTFQRSVARITRRLKFQNDAVIVSLSKMLDYGFLYYFDTVMAKLDQYTHLYGAIFADYEASLQQSNSTGLIDIVVLQELQIAAAGSFRNVVRDTDLLMEFVREVNESLSLGYILRYRPVFQDAVSRRTNRPIIHRDFDETLIPWFLLNKFAANAQSAKILRIALSALSNIKRFFGDENVANYHSMIFSNYTGVKNKVDLSVTIITHFSKHLALIEKQSRTYLEDYKNKYLFSLTQIREAANNLNTTLRQILGPKTNSLLNELSNLKPILDFSENYVNNRTLNKTDLAHAATDTAISNTIDMLDSLGYTVIEGGRNLQRDYLKYTEIYNQKLNLIQRTNASSAFLEKFVTLMREFRSNETAVEDIANGLSLNFTDTKVRDDFYAFITTDIDISDPVLELSDLSRAMELLDFQCDLEQSTRGAWRSFIDHLYEWRQSLHTFLMANELDAEFFQTNFLDMEIFMKELYYEEIEQRVAYDLIALFSDIGGSLGLCIGASIITLIEMMDVIVHNAAKIHYS